MDDGLTGILPTPSACLFAGSYSGRCVGDELGPVVALGLERLGGLAFGAFLAPLLLACRPLVQAGVGSGAFARHLHFVGQLG